MKKKLLITVLSLVCAIVCAFAFVACGGVDDDGNGNKDNPGGAQHVHSYTWIDNGDGTHSGRCSIDGCDEPDVDNEAHSWGKNDKCTKCSAVKAADEHAHSFIESADPEYLKSEATCTSKAVYYKSCIICGDKDTETFEYGAAVGHTLTQEVAEPKYLKTAATCTAKSVYYKSCSVCGETGAATFEYGQANGHTFTREQAEAKYLNTSATCQRKAIYYKSCESCGEKGTDTFEYGDIADHSYTLKFSVDEYLKSEATCTDKAVYYYSCIYCFETGADTYEEGEASGHRFINYRYNNDAACTKDGTKTATCEICTQTDTIIDNAHPMTGHAFTQENIEEKYLKSAATCTAKAVYYKSCANCGEADTATFENGDIAEHSYIKEEADDKYLKSQATCTSRAVYYKSCVSCGKAGAETFEYGTNDKHAWQDNQCSICGLDGGGSKGMRWTLNEDETEYTLLKIGSCSDKKVIIPAAYNGLPVTTVAERAFYDCVITGIEIPKGVTNIGDYAFEDCSRIREITLPDSITSIGNYAFKNCSALNTTITLPANLVSLGSGVFDGCDNLRGVSIDESNTVYASQDGILYNKAKTEFLLIPEGIVIEVTIPDSIEIINEYTFIGKKIAGIVLGAGVKSIGEYAFCNCTSLNSIKLSNATTNIGKNAFENCISLTGITIAQGVTSIAENAFNNCSKLESITADINNTAYASSDGILYNKNKTEFAYIPEALKGDITIAEGVTSIAAKAFEGRGITSITLPSALTYIGRDAFNNCSSLRYNTYNDVMYLSSSDNLYFALIKRTQEISYCEIHHDTKIIASYAFASCATITKVSIPSKVTHIGDSAFSLCGNLASVTFNNNLKSIGNAAFNGCKLNNVTLPDSITSIGNYAFAGCNLTAITFNGNKEQWLAVEKGDDWNNYYYCTITCSNGKLDKNGNEIAD